jgi:hypothetical protein
MMPGQKDDDLVPSKYGFTTTSDQKAVEKAMENLSGLAERFAAGYDFWIRDILDDWASTVWPRTGLFSRLLSAKSTYRIEGPRGGVTRPDQEILTAWWSVMVGDSYRTEASARVALAFDMGGKPLGFFVEAMGTKGVLPEYEVSPAGLVKFLKDGWGTRGA